MKDVEMVLIGMGISTLLFTLLGFLGQFTLTCFDLAGLKRIPNDTWRADSEKF